MEFITLKTNNKMPLLGLGTWQLTGTSCTNAVKKALELGYTHIDTAEIYGNEAEIGKALVGVDRKKLFITSKVWSDNASYEETLDAFEQSVSKLGTNYLDLYLIHWPKDGVDLNGCFKAFKKLYVDGKVKSVGVSNFTVHHLSDAMKITDELELPIAVNQVEFHPGLYQKELLEFCKKNNIVVTAYSPLSRGTVGENKILNDIAVKHSRTAAQVSLRWLIQRGLVVIPKSSSENHLSENLNIFDFELDEKDMKNIDNLGSDSRLINPTWMNFNY